MMNTSKTILFFGTDDFSSTSLEKLILADYNIGAVITKPDSHSGRGRKLTPPIVKTIALKHNIPVWQPAKLSDISDKIAEFDYPLGVLVSYGKIIPSFIIDLFKPGIINIHPSLLPKYRGPSPIESAILNGDAQTGVTIMQLTPEMDAGPIYSQTVVDLVGTETAPELEQKLAQLGAEQLLQILPAIMHGSLSPIEQDSSSATYCNLLRKQDSVLNPEEYDAQRLERQIRAYQVFPKSRIDLSGHTVIVTRAHIGHDENTSTDIVCRDGSILSIDSLVAPSGKQMSAADYRRGYQGSGF